VRRGPPITLTCECGERRELRYGELWRCETCGRAWDTNRIPLGEYAAIRHAQLRHMIIPVAVSLAVAAGAIVLILTGRSLVAILIVPMAGYVWSQFIRPARRRRRYREISELPRWEIKAE
jgi:Flp pilus assembly protein TadB